MQPEHYINEICDAKFYLEHIIATTGEIGKSQDKAIPQTPAIIIAERNDLIIAVDNALFYVRHALESVKKAIETARAIEKEKTAPEYIAIPTTRRWIVENGQLKEATAEQAAEAEGLTVENMLAKEQELAHMTDEDMYELSAS